MSLRNASGPKLKPLSARSWLVPCRHGPMMRCRGAESVRCARVHRGPRSQGRNIPPNGLGRACVAVLAISVPVALSLVEGVEPHHHSARSA